MSSKRVAVIAATSALGRRVINLLLARGMNIVAVGRDPAKLDSLPASVEKRLTNLMRPSALKAALADTALIASCAPVSYLPGILSSLPEQTERLVVMASSRRYSAYPEATAMAAIEAEALLAGLPIPNVLLFSSMIYGYEGSVLGRWAGLVRRWPVLVVPGEEAARIQPIHIDDVAASVVAAITEERAPGLPIVIAGGEALTQRMLIRRIAERLEKQIVLLPVPRRLARSLASSSRHVPRLKGISETLLRLFEDRRFDITPMRERLGVNPRALDLTALR